MAPDDSNENINRIARVFVDARRSGRALADYPGEMPAGLDTAYAVQDEALKLSGRTVAGWKVGRIHPPVEGFDRLAGPIFEDQVVIDRGTPIDMPVFVDGFAAAEAEFLLRVGTAPDPGRTSYTTDEARELIDAVHVGIEIASSPFPGINDYGPGVTISDFGNNNGLIVGAAIRRWREVDFATWSVEISVAGERVGVGSSAAMLDGPFGAARFLFELMAARGIAVTPGQWISSGAVTGVHPVLVGEPVTATFDGRLTVGCRIKAL